MFVPSAPELAMVTVMGVPVGVGRDVGLADAMGVDTGSDGVGVGVSLAVADPGRIEPVAHPESGSMTTSSPRIARRARGGR